MKNLKEHISVSVNLNRKLSHIEITIFFGTLMTQEDFLRVLTEQISARKLTGIFRLYYHDMNITCFTQKIQELQCSISHPPLKDWGEWQKDTFQIPVFDSPKEVDLLLRNSFLKIMEKIYLENVVMIQLSLSFKEKK